MINVTRTHIPDPERFKQYVDRILKSGWLTNNGSVIQELETELKKFLNTEFLVLTVNGTCALQLAFKLMGLKGDVITTPFTFIATISSLVWEGLNPVFADIDEESLNIDPDSINKCITKNTTCIVPVHVFGNPCEVDKIEAIGKKNNLRVIYDAAHAFDVHVNGTSISNFGDIAVYSFHSTKIFHTIEGGAIVLRNKELYEKALLMRNFGIPNYDQITELGVNFKMNEFQAAMGLCVLNDFKEVSLRRAEVFRRYQSAFNSDPRLRLQKISGDVIQNYSYFPVIFSNESKLISVKKALNEKNIFPRRYFYPSLNELPYLPMKQSMPVSERISRTILCLPLFAGLEPDTQDQIIETTLKFA